MANIDHLNVFPQPEFSLVEYQRHPKSWINTVATAVVEVESEAWTRGAVDLEKWPPDQNTSKGNAQSQSCCNMHRTRKSGAHIVHDL